MPAMTITPAVKAELVKVKEEAGGKVQVTAHAEEISGICRGKDAKGVLPMTGNEGNTAVADGSGIGAKIIKSEAADLESRTGIGHGRAKCSGGPIVVKSEVDM
jgi:hypothetical protein